MAHTRSRVSFHSPTQSHNVGLRFAMQSYTAWHATARHTPAWPSQREGPVSQWVTSSVGKRQYYPTTVCLGGPQVTLAQIRVRHALSRSKKSVKGKRQGDRTILFFSPPTFEQNLLSPNCFSQPRSPSRDIGGRQVY